MFSRQINGKAHYPTSGLTREHPVHSRTPNCIELSIRLPSVMPTGRWRERGRMGRMRRTAHLLTHPPEHSCNA
jgi:hypothetical protein